MENEVSKQEAAEAIAQEPVTGAAPNENLTWEELQERALARLDEAREKDEQSKLVASIEGAPKAGEEPKTKEEPKAAETPKADEKAETKPVADEKAKEENPAELKPEDLLNQKVKVKVYGKEKEVTVKEAVDNYQKIQAAQQMFAQAKDIQETNKTFIKDIKETPFSLLMQLHINDKDIFTSMETFEQKHLIPFMERWVELKNLSPEDRKHYQETHLQHLDAESAKQKLAEYEKKEQETKLDQAKTKLRTEILSHAKTAGLPENDSIVAQIAKVFSEKSESGAPITIIEAAQLVKAERDGSKENLAKSLSKDEIAKLHPDLIEQIKADIRKNLLEETKAAITTSTVKPERTDTEKREKGKKTKPQTLDDIQERLFSKYGI